MTDGGKPLLQVCIENENDNGWQLKKLMQILLEKSQTDPNINDKKNQYTLLTFCYKNKKHQAFNQLIKSCVLNIKINQANNIDQSTIYGTLFYNCELDYYEKEGFKPREKLDMVLKTYYNKLNTNKAQIKIGGMIEKLFTPIYWYIKEKYYD